ncbi:hypothetical protein J5N97_023493 [Dioscorea zingiberensis]|uniref:ARC105/Med15 mediator subunit C-terminal domain-containing protein n=1 Tax=Dioscorea zingiberensis TaxID=325984 RepID=A0A9D5C4Y2_9LILI|nr:hypothetical protein J5N97_023493 [Dioscorea zingiberensis]
MPSNTDSPSNLQNFSQTSASSSVEQRIPDNNVTVQRPIQGRQQQPLDVSYHQKQFPSPNFYQHQIQKQILKQNGQQTSLLQQHLQQQTQQHPQQGLMHVPSGHQSGNLDYPNIHQNYSNSVQQSGLSLLHKHPWSPLVQHKPTSTSQQSSLPWQGQPSNQQSYMSNVQQTQQSSLPDMQQQRLSFQQNNQQGISLHQQQPLGPQNNIMRLRQHQQLIGTLPGVPNIQALQSLIHGAQVEAEPHQEEPQRPSLTLLQLQSQGHLARYQSIQEQMKAHLLPQPPMHQQKFQSPVTLSPSPSAVGQQRQKIQLQKEFHEGSSTCNMLHADPNFILIMVYLLSTLPNHSVLLFVAPKLLMAQKCMSDLKEEIYQKIKNLRETYYKELNENLRILLIKLKQLDALPPHQKQPDQCTRLQNCKNFVQRAIAYLGIPRSNIHPQLKERLILLEKHIRVYLELGSGKWITSSLLERQQESQHRGGHVDLVRQHQPSGASLMQSNYHVNHERQMHLGASVTSAAEVAASTFIPSGAQSGMPKAQQNIMNALASGLHPDSAQGSCFNSLQHQSIGSSHQVGIGSIQATSCRSYYNNTNRQLQGSVNPLQIASTTQPIPYPILQQKQEQKQLMQTQEVQHPSQHHHSQLWLIQQSFRQHGLRQQMLPERKQSQTIVPGNHLQLHQMNAANDMNDKQNSGSKPGDCQNHFSTVERHNYARQLKGLDSVNVSSPQNLQASSPPLSPPSPESDWGSLLTVFLDEGISSKPIDSLLINKSPSTPSVPEEPEQQGKLSLPNAGHNGQHQTTNVSIQASVLVLGTPAMSASPLIPEFAGPDSDQGNTTTEKLTKKEDPERLIKVVQSSIPEVLGFSISDIRSVVDMMNIFASSPPGNGSGAAVGENLTGLTKRFLPLEKCKPEVWFKRKKARCSITITPWINEPFPSSINGGFNLVDSLNASELESIATSSAQCHPNEVTSAIIEEIREINQQLIDTVVSVSDVDADHIAAQAEDLDGMVIGFAFSAVSVNPNLISQFAPAHMSPIMSLRLIVPPDYPKNSPVVLDKLPYELSKESEDLTSKAMSNFNRSLLSLSQPISLGKMAKLWDTSIRELILEYAHQHGGGSFSSRIGTWQTCVCD